MFLNQICRPSTLRCGALLLVVINAGSGLIAAEGKPERGEIVARVRADIEYFASDALEGRGIETKGIELAAERIIAEYKKFGLKPGMPDGKYRQPFPVTIGDVAVAASTKVELTQPDGMKIPLKLAEQYQPIRRGANGEATGGLAFIGYGISSEEEGYDDYAGIDVAGKVVVLIRREPQNRDGGAFGGKATSPNAYIDRKLELIRKSKAAAVLFVNNLESASDPGADDLADPSSFGNEGEAVPFVHVKRSVIDSILKATPLKVGDELLGSLAAVSEYIDLNLKPVSQELPGWNATVSTVFQATTISTDNLIGVIEGEGPLADETIVIGGHYDHLGFGGYGSRTQNRTGEVHNGADDNASGTAAVVELARRIASGPKPKRRMVFICFSGEERGLIGSNHYVKHPAFPLENTVAMLNFDMIGNLRKNRVEVNGVGTATEFEAIVHKADEVTPIDITIVPGAFAGSDHLPFYQKNIPVMFCFTGMTDIYHTPDDDYSTLNIEGAVTVIDYSEQLLRGIDALETRPTFAEGSRGNRRPAVARTPFLGIQPNITASGDDGIVIRGVRPDSPASTAGLQTGDVVTTINDEDVKGYQTLVEKLTDSKAGDVLKLKVKRGQETLDVDVTLGEARR
ncbi:MAG: M20/M25/M40 family metallo-hydrolase [Planctomycetaceae bacterium]